MSVKLGRTVVQASLDLNGQVVECLSIFLSQPSKSTARWLITVRARVDEGLFVVGEFTTCPPRDGSPSSRIVAQSVCPGAREWTVDVGPAPAVEGLVAVADDSALQLGGGNHAPTLPAGVQRISERPKTYSGVAGVVQLLPGEELVGWTAWASGAGATVTYGGVPEGDPMVVPTGGTLEGSAGGLVQGPATITFTGTSSYLVEVAESA